MRREQSLIRPFARFHHLSVVCAPFGNFWQFGASFGPCMSLSPAGSCGSLKRAPSLQAVHILFGSHVTSFGFISRQPGVAALTCLHFSTQSSHRRATTFTLCNKIHVKLASYIPAVGLHNTRMPHSRENFHLQWPIETDKRAPSVFVPASAQTLSNSH